MNSLFYSTGQVARQLGTTLATVRLLCENGTIAAETSPGGHLRISASQVERLKRDGLPPIPRPLPTGSAPRARNGKAGHHGHPELPAEPSAEVLTAAEQVEITKSMLEKRKIDRELEETEDWFRGRADQQAQREAEQREVERRLQAEVEAERRQHEWHNHWLTQALDSIPGEARGQVETDVHEEVCRVLANTSPEAQATVVQRLVDAAVGKALRPWRRRKEAARVVERAVSQLPFEARNYFQPTAWQIRATQRARAAAEALPEAAELREIEAAAKGAVDQVTEEYRDAEVRRNVKECACRPLRQQVSDAGTQMAEDAIDKALAALPPGTPKSKLEAACEKALEPFRAAVAQRQAEDQDRASREWVLRLLPFKFPLRFAIEAKEPALAAVREAIAQLPIGTTQSDMEKARDTALRPFLDAHEQRERKKDLIEVGLREIFPYILKLQQDWDFEGATAWTLEAEAKEPIRTRLDAEITGAESDEDVRRKVRRFVREEFEAVG